MIVGEPIWREGLAAPSYPRVETARLRAEVAIVGGGFAGLSAAYHLVRRWPGARVVVLEAGRLGAGASGHTTGMLGPGVGQSLPALLRRHGPARARALYRATLDAVAAVVALVEREELACELELTGQLVVARSRAGATRVAALGRALQRLGLPGEVLDRDELARFIHLGAAFGGDGAAAIRLPAAGTLHPLRLLLGLADRVTRRGGSIFEHARVRAIGHGAPVRLELADGAVVTADHVVLATAGYTPGLGVFRGRVLPVHLQVVATEPLDGEAREALGWKGREGVLDSRRVFDYFRLTADDRIVFGGGRPRYYWGGARESAVARAAALAGLAGELSHTFGSGLGLRVARGWTGVIGYVADALPAIHRLRDRPSVLHAVGWCGHGVALSLASGAWVADMLGDGAVTEDLPWFRTDPPLLPGELTRWAGFRGSVRLMQLRDRFA
jgi:gamma-glutamylputrescine oxidase